MKVIVDTDQIAPVIEAIRQLPVQVDKFDTADVWVGCILTLQRICMQSAPYQEENNKEGE